MIGLFFIYSFMSGAYYAVGNGELKTKFHNDKYSWTNRPIALVFSLLWPIMVFVFYFRKAWLKICLPNHKDQGADSK